MKIDFYYWNAMCPINQEMIALLKEYEKTFDINYIEISDKPDLAKKMHIYFPTLTVINEGAKFYSPLKASILNEWAKGEVHDEKESITIVGQIKLSYDIVPIVEANYHMASRCTGRTCVAGCADKISFLQNHGLNVFGYMNIKGDTLLGGAEYLPSEMVPYNIPKDKETAFITCVYLSDETYDYKTAPLLELEKFLSDKYKRAIVISDETDTFPNGDMDFFLRNGYEDLGVIYVDRDHCKLHLMSKKLA